MTQLKDGDEAIGNHVKVKVVKNKVRLLSVLLNSILFLVRVFQKQERSLIWVLNWGSYKKAEVV
jgi:hypothetical protein